MKAKIKHTGGNLMLIHSTPCNKVSVRYTPITWHYTNIILESVYTTNTVFARNWVLCTKKREPHCIFWLVVNYIHKWNTMSGSHKVGRKIGLRTKRCYSSWFSSHHQAKGIILTNFSLLIFFNTQVRGAIKTLTFWTDHNTSKLVQSNPVFGTC